MRFLFAFILIGALATGSYATSVSVATKAYAADSGVLTNVYFESATAPTSTTPSVVTAHDTAGHDGLDGDREERHRLSVFHAVHERQERRRRPVGVRRVGAVLEERDDDGHDSSGELHGHRADDGRQRDDPHGSDHERDRWSSA